MKHRLPQTYARAVYQLLAQGDEPTRVAHALTKSLSRNRDSHRLKDIMREIEALAKRNGKDVITVTTADAQVAAAAEGQIAPHVKGAHVETIVDPTLIGGIKIQREDVQIDASLQTLLHDLSLSLT